MRKYEKSLKALIISILVVFTIIHLGLENFSYAENLPDLAITEIKITQIELSNDYYPKLIKATISYTWQNQGTEIALSHPDHVRLFDPKGNTVPLISTAGNYGSNNDYIITPMGNVRPEDGVIEVTSNGGVYAFITKDWIPGEYTVRVELDANNIISESDETNNILEKKLLVSVPIPRDGPFTLPCSMQEKGDGVFTSSCNGIYENGMAKAKVGINYGSGLFPIKNYVAVGYFIDKNGNQGPNIKVTLDQINPKESKELVFVNPISGFVSEFKMQMLGGKIVTSEPKPVITCPDGFDLSSDGKCVIAPGRPKIESKTELKTSKSSSTVQLNGKTFDITYEATGLTIYTIQADTSSATITVSLANVDASGTLQIVFDRSFFDSRTNNSDDQFLVLADGAEAQFTEIKTDASRTLTITVPAGTNNVDIVSQGNTNFGNSVSKNSKPSETKTTVIPPTPTKTKPLACGNGTVLDSKTNTCIVASATISTQTTPAKATTETNTVSKATPAKATTETNTVSKATPAKATDSVKKTDEKTKRIELAKEKAKERVLKAKELAKQKVKSKSK